LKPGLSPTASERRNLYDVKPAELPALLHDFVAPSFRIAQIADWLYRRGVSSFAAMTNLSLSLRADLAERFSIELPTGVASSETAPDGSRKTLFTLADGSLVESVFMPMGERTSICLSSQAGCAVGCTFCVTGFFGAGRNLTPAEIVGQYYSLRNEHSVPSEQMNVVFMGMGEPLLNFENVVTALDILGHDIAPRRMTISTAGIIPGIRELARLPKRPNLAVSINAPDQVRREQIMPITAKYPLEDLVSTLRDYPLEHGREITAEYVLLASYNDSVEDAAALARLLRGLRVKVNAIPFNPDPNLPEWMKRPTDEAIDRFVRALVRQEVAVTVRRSKGRDIAAACGQLRGRTEPRRPRAR
jgi:23S rRNA (adenine2503-C2)-methyltransferase